MASEEDARLTFGIEEIANSNLSAAQLESPHRLCLDLHQPLYQQWSRNIRTRLDDRAPACDFRNAFKALDAEDDIVIVCGKTGVGKSSALNSLIGMQILPPSGDPLKIAIPIEIRRKGATQTSAIHIKTFYASRADTEKTFEQSLEVYRQDPLAGVQKISRSSLKMTSRS